MPARSDAERFPTTATVALVRVIELEAFVQAFTDKIQLRAVDVGQALGVDQNLDTLLFENDVFRLDLVGELNLVSQTLTAGGLHTQADPNTLATTGQVASDVTGSGVRQLHLHVGVDFGDFSQRPVSGACCARTCCGGISFHVWPCNR